jgi:hypothetical protein
MDSLGSSALGELSLHQVGERRNDSAPIAKPALRTVRRRKVAMDLLPIGVVRPAALDFP